MALLTSTWRMHHAATNDPAERARLGHKINILNERYTAAVESLWQMEGIVFLLFEKNIVDAVMHLTQFESAQNKFQETLTQFWQLEKRVGIIFPDSICERLSNVKAAFLGFRQGVYQDSRKFSPLMDSIDEAQEEFSQAIKLQL
jgi:hypothetical protein